MPTCSLWERDGQQFLLAKGVASGSSAWVPLGKGTTKKEGKNILLVSPAQSSSQTLHIYGKIACSSGKLLLGGFFLCRLTCLLQFFNWKYWFSMCFLKIFLAVFLWFYWKDCWVSLKKWFFSIFSISWHFDCSIDFFTFLKILILFNMRCSGYGHLS